MVEEKEPPAAVVDFQKALEKKVATNGKSSVLKKLKARAKESRVDDSPLNFLKREEIRMTLGLTQEDVFKLIEDFEKENPTAHLEDEIQSLREACKDHYEKWEKEQKKRRTLESENAELKSVMQSFQISLADNATYYVFLALFIGLIITLLVVAE